MSTPLRLASWRAGVVLGLAAAAAAARAQAPAAAPRFPAPARYPPSAPVVPAPDNLQLFLLIGQSNMSGRGLVEPQDRVPIPRVYSLNQDLQWVPALDPIQLERLSGVSLGRSFGRELAAANPSASIGLIPAAVGATYLGEWMKGGQYYEEAVRRAKAAMKFGRLRGILWHQGEGDGQQETDALTYGARWTKMIADLRADLGVPDLPVVVGELCRSVYSRPDGKTKYALEVNEQLATLPLSVADCAFVSSYGLKDRGDHVHFDSASQRELGRRYAHAFLELDPAWVESP
jgi:hypothetical protein